MMSQIIMPKMAAMLRGSSIERGCAMLFHCRPTLLSSQLEMIVAPWPKAVLDSRLRASLPPL